MGRFSDIPRAKVGALAWSHRLFVYGSLQPDTSCPIQSLIGRPVRWVGRARVRGRLVDLGRYPGLIDAVHLDQWVAGWVCLLPDRRALARVDRYEQAGPGFVRFGEYRRVLETVWLDSGEALRCWMYRYNRNSGRRPVVKRLAAGCKPDLFAWRQSSR